MTVYQRRSRFFSCAYISILIRSFLQTTCEKAFGEGKRLSLYFSPILTSTATHFLFTSPSFPPLFCFEISPLDDVYLVLKKQYPHLFLTCSRKRGKKIEVLILFRFCLFYRRLADGSVGALQRYLSAADCDATIQQRRSAHNIGRFWPVSTSRQQRIDAGSALLRRTDGPFIADLLHMELFAAVVLVRLQQ